MIQDDFKNLDKTILLAIIKIFSNKIEIPIHHSVSDEDLSKITFEAYKAIKKITIEYSKEQKYSKEKAIKELDELIKETIKNMKKIENSNAINNALIESIRKNNSVTY